MRQTILSTMMASVWFLSFYFFFMDKVHGFQSIFSVTSRHQHHLLSNNNAFQKPQFVSSSPSSSQRQSTSTSSSSRLLDAKSETATDEIIARRIIVKGDVQGGYYRSCVLNEVSKIPFSLRTKVEALMGFNPCSFVYI